ncbi:hypothetical protein ACOI1H_08860 [Loktanella sp. DJP18]|uniref:hypothetical protein n=1 Tax=Loktanella sp. DJP18 TaxID=3409788 RepID=UPI003BB620CD
MVESSKILTVSYGTFSCTLEGFDDSFSTMKAIAEYFRDLAAGDRYFGAEPPTPDAEMLTRIAEREISRRVEMRTSDTGIVLRVSDATPQTQVAAQATPSTDQPVSQAAPQSQTDPADQAGAADDGDAAPVMPPAPRRPQGRDGIREQARAVAQDADLTQDEPARPRAEVPAHPDSESVAAKLQRIRAVVGGVVPPVATPSPFVEDLEDLPEAVDTPDTARPMADAVADPANSDSQMADAGQDTAQDADPDVTTTDDVDDRPELDAAPSSAPSMSDSETDAVIARAIAVFDGLDDVAKTEPTQAEADDQAVLAEDDDDDAGTDAEAPTRDADADETDDQISAVLRNLQRAGLRSPHRDATPSAAPEAESSVADRTVDAQPPAQPAPRGRILRVTRRPRPMNDAEDQAAAAEPTPAAVPERETAPRDDAATTTASISAMLAKSRQTQGDMDAAAPSHDASDPLDFDTAGIDFDDEADGPMIDGQIIDGPIIDGEADGPAIAKDQPETDLDTGSAATTFETSVAALDGASDLPEFDRTPAGSTLSEEDEADLQRTLAALKHEAEIVVSTAAPLATSATPPFDAAEQSPKMRRDPLPDPSEAEMTRIMSQANEELADPEASRRRNAIAHLKAAVAATEAARQLGDKAVTPVAPEGVFRDDLEQVVRPRRAPRADAAVERSERPRPAPLKLVASQRIDLEDAPAPTPVQPRRVAMTSPAPAEDADNFAAFAESMGATSLQDLLEAAAAYTAYVEGSEDFSRPHIMQKVRQTVTEDFSREDGLRSFGTLLRQNRIERSRNGRFTVTDGNRFKPEAIAAGA